MPQDYARVIYSLDEHKVKFVIICGMASVSLGVPGHSKRRPSRRTLCLCGSKSGHETVAPGRALPHQPFNPVVAMPRMKVFWARKNRTTIGAMMTALAAMRWCHCTPPAWLW